MHVISANYKDRTNKNYRWIARDVDRDEGDICKAVVAENIKFEMAFGKERENGCSIVAVAERVKKFGVDGSPDHDVPSLDLSKHSELHYNGFVFCIGEVEVESLDQLVILQDGRIYGLNVNKEFSKAATYATA